MQHRPLPLSTNRSVAAGTSAGAVLARKGKPETPGRLPPEQTDLTDPGEIRRTCGQGPGDGRDFFENYLSDINKGDQ